MPEEMVTGAQSSRVGSSGLKSPLETVLSRPEVAANTGGVRHGHARRRGMPAVGDSGGPRSHAPSFGRLEEPLEQLAEFASAPEVLGVPLHADAERRAGTFDRFDHAVGRRADTTNPGASAFTDRRFRQLERAGRAAEADQKASSRRSVA